MLLQERRELTKQFSSGERRVVLDESAENGDSASSAGPKQTTLSRFMPTSRRIVQFSDGVPAPPGARIVYIDGAFDLFHPGHVEILKVCIILLQRMGSSLAAQSLLQVYRSSGMDAPINQDVGMPRAREASQIADLRIVHGVHRADVCSFQAIPCRCLCVRLAEQSVLLGNCVAQHPPIVALCWKCTACVASTQTPPSGGRAPVVRVLPALMRQTLCLLSCCVRVHAAGGGAVRLLPMHA